MFTSVCIYVYIYIYSSLYKHDACIKDGMNLKFHSIRISLKF